MNHPLFEFLQCSPTFNWSAVTPVIAIVVSILALLINRTIAQKNIRLTIQQAIFKTVSEKSKDCNTLWQNEPTSKTDQREPHYKVISELIISIEVIDKSFYLFEKNYKSVRDYQDDYYYLFWKQLRTDLRGFIMLAPIIAKTVGNEYYTKQIEDLHILFKKHFEQQL